MTRFFFVPRRVHARRTGTCRVSGRAYFPWTILLGTLAQRRCREVLALEEGCHEVAATIDGVRKTSARLRDQPNG